MEKTLVEIDKTELLRETLKRLGLTVREAAEAWHVSSSTLSLAHSGRCKIPDNYWLAILDYENRIHAAAMNVQTREAAVIARAAELNARAAELRKARQKAEAAAAAPADQGPRHIRRRNPEVSEQRPAPHCPHCGRPFAEADAAGMHQFPNGNKRIVCPGCKLPYILK